ncbi:MAG: hypothetical protein IJ071_07035 [Ruminococcus sp.]|nr:hypothetical protein [Ruminococcus sp.]
MGKILETSGSCPYCGRRISGYDPRIRKYGSPLIKCTACGQTYLDRRFTEIEAEGARAEDLTAGTGVKAMLLGIAAIAVCGGFTLYTVKVRDYYSLKMVMCIILGAVVFIAGLVDTIQVKSGARSKKLDRYREESRQRLADPDYAQALAELGYDVPYEFRKGGDQ